MARIYVGTYAKYSSGSIEGQWLDPEDYAGLDDFIEACRALHKNEADPELMFQDWEECAGYVTESHIDPALWDWMELSENEREAVQAYRDAEGSNDSIEYILDGFLGTYDDPEDYAQEVWSNRGDIPDDILGYIDWDSVVRDMEHGGTAFIRHAGQTFVFAAH